MYAKSRASCVYLLQQQMDASDADGSASRRNRKGTLPLTKLKHPPRDANAAPSIPTLGSKTTLFPIPKFVG